VYIKRVPRANEPNNTSWSFSSADVRVTETKEGESTTESGNVASENAVDKT